MSLKFKSNQQIVKERERGEQKAFNFRNAVVYVIPLLGAFEVIAMSSRIQKKVSGVSGRFALHIFISLLYFPLVGAFIPILQEKARRNFGVSREFFQIFLFVLHILIILAPIFYVRFLNKIDKAAKENGIDLWD